MFRIVYLFLVLSCISVFDSIHAQSTSRPFITVWKTDNPGKSNDNQISFNAGGTNFLVEWELVSDPTVKGSQTFSGNVELTFPQAGTYRIKIGQGLTSFSTTRSTNSRTDNSDAKKIIELQQWGDIAWINLTYGFNFATNILVTATDAPNLSSVTSLYALFYQAEKMNADFNHWDVSTITSLNRTFGECLVFNGNVNNWNVSKVWDFSLTFQNAKVFEGDLSKWNVSSATNMIRMFSGAEKFNSDISNWDVSNVRSMSSMFQSAGSFTSNLSSWNVSSVTTMASMFSSASSFNSDLNSWDVSNVTSMRSMFSFAATFNGNISNWNVGKVTTFGLMFTSARTFNQDLSKWDVTSATNLEWMFNGATAFTSDLSSWNVSKVTDFSLVFANAKAFTSDLSKWDVSKGEDFEWMFLGAENFTSDLSKWNVSNAKKLNRMFYDARSFTSDLSSWNVSQSPDLNGMFYRATKFDSDLSSWNVSNATNMANFADQSAMSIANVDKLLQSWAQQNVKSNVTLGLSQLKFRFAKAAKQKLTTEKGWVIKATECSNCTYTAFRGKEGWRMISNPFPNVTVAALLDGLWTQGMEGADILNGSPNVLVYNMEKETFEPAKSLNQSVSAGTALLVWVFADDNATLPGIQGGFPKFIERSDNEHNDEIAPQINSTPGDSDNRGWSLLGNPFNAPILWNKLARGAGIGQSVYVWSARDSSYISYNGAVGGLARGAIAPFQGFWIQNKRNGARDFKFQKSAKEDTISYYSKREETTYFRLEIRQGSRRNSTYVMFNEHSSFAGDDWDALKLTPLTSQYLQLATLDSDGVALDIQSLPILENQVHLPLSTTSTMNGIAELTISESNIPEGWVIALKNVHDGSIVSLIDSPVTIDVSAITAKANPSLKPANLYAQDRTKYELVVGPHVTTTTEPELLPERLALLPSYPNPFNPTTTVRFSLPQSEFITVGIYDISGRAVAELVSGTMSAGTHSIVWDARMQASGTYLVRLTANGTTIHQKLTLLK